MSRSTNPLAKLARFTSKRGLVQAKRFFANTLQWMNDERSGPLSPVSVAAPSGAFGTGVTGGTGAKVKARQTPTAQPASAVLGEASATAAVITGPIAPLLKVEPSVDTPERPLAQPRPASFTKHHFELHGERHAYRLFLPSLPDRALAAGLPLVVLLHGCKQNAADFALGTAMNTLAEKHKCMVLYPEQNAKANQMRCWNWFDVAHQGHTGEPALLVQLTQQIAKRCKADTERIYIAGLSAGGAMAAVVAALYPDVFAAVGVHSGLPPGAATDVISAFSAMRRGGMQRPFAGHRAGVMPTIVFHGQADDTVHPDNSEHIVAVALKALQSSGLQLVKTEQDVTPPAPKHAGDRPHRPTHQTVYRAADGKPYLECWSVDTGPHAWSGGNAAGSFTDPQGPSASAAMLAFFLRHRKTAAA